MRFSSEMKASLMFEALSESRKALPTCLPNPPVGCVIVRDGKVVARGFTGAPGTPHAEAAAIAALGAVDDPGSLAAFVTLEPCAFTGRTPSCARALVASRVAAVFVGLVDPDPRNNGAGLHILREAGIEVEHGVLAGAISEFLAPYLASATTDASRDDRGRR